MTNNMREARNIKKGLFADVKVEIGAFQQSRTQKFSQVHSTSVMNWKFSWKNPLSVGKSLPPKIAPETSPLIYFLQLL
jgi:hypothetical protein